MDVRRIVGTNLRQFRLSAGLSQEEMAARMGVEQGYLGGLEAGRRNPTVVTLWHAAMALGIRPSLLLEAPDAKLAKPALRASSRRKTRTTKASR
jgi:transcriptional regulator with XRE-family HTH domain